MSQLLVFSAVAVGVGDDVAPVEVLVWAFGPRDPQAPLKSSCHT